jgi:hypothetical protein
LATNVGHGAAYIQLRPDTSNFRTEARAQLSAIVLDTKVRLRPDLSGFRAAVRTALSAMPAASVNVKADATFLRSSIRATLAAMPPASVRVNADLGGSATAQLAALDTAASALDGRVINMRVDLDATAAFAQLALLNVAANALDGRNIDINVNINGASIAALNGLAGAASGSLGGVSSRLRLIIDAIITLGSIASPILAGAAAGAVALTGALVSVGAGAGVAILALSGVVGAVAALNKAEDERAKASALSVRQGKQVANSNDQVRTALAGVASAERNYASAQRDALRAQRDINEAREDAKRGLEDLDSSVKNNNLSIRQAQLDLERAKADLNKVLGDPEATQRQRREAQLTYDQAAQQITDLTTRQKRLGEEQKAAQKAGVEGSKEVVAAQERARDAQERVTDAASSLAQAQQAVASAQRSVAASIASTSATEGAALDDLKRRMQSLSPAGRDFANYLFSLKPAMLDLRREAETGFLPGLQSGLERLSLYLPKVQDFIRRVAEELGSLADRGADALAGPRFRDFFRYIDTTATHTIEQFARVLGNTGEGFGNLLVAFLPFQRQFTGGLVDMTEKFARWSRSLETNDGFQDFLAYAQEQGPKVVETLGDLTEMLFHILDAAAPIGSVVLGVLQALAAVINSIPTPVLTVLVGALVALRAAALISMIPLGALGARLSTLPGQMIAMTTSMGAFRAGMGAFVGFLGGPWTLAVVGAAAVLGLIVSNTGKAKERVDNAKAAFQQFGDSMKEGVTPAALENAQQVIRNNKALADLVRVSRDAGISSQTLIAGLNGDKRARTDVISAIDAQIAKQRQLMDAETDSETGVLSRKGEDALERIKRLKELKQAFEDASTSEQRAAALSEYFKLQQADLNEAMKDGARAADILRKAYDTLAGEQVSRQEALEDERAAYDALREAVERNGPTLDENTKQGRENNDLVRARIETLNGLVAADVAATGVVSANTQAKIDALKRELLQMGFTEEQVNKLLKLYQQVKPEIVTQLILKGGGDVERGLNAVGLAAAKLIATYGLSVDDALLIAGGGLPPSWRGPSPSALSAQRNADGGPIHGPGGPRDDKILSWLSNGEFVQPTSVVNHYGASFMEDLRQKRIPKEQLIGGYATGGLVTHTTDPRNWRQYPKFQARTQQMTADLQQTLLAGQAAQQMQYTGGGAGGEQYYNAVSQTAYKTAMALNASTKVLLALMEAGIVESGMRNLNYGDRDSVGFLQQRPSMGWPNPRDVPTATRSFVLRAMPKEKLYPNRTAGMLAQSVQVSAYPDKYDQVEPQARSVLGILGGGGRVSGLAAAGALNGVGMGSGKFAPQSRGWPARQFRKLSPNTAAAQAFIRRTWGVPSYPSLERRDRFDHPWGKALDNMTNAFTGPGRAAGDSMARHFVANPGQFGTKYVIWREKITTDGRGWRPYSGDSAHNDHVHLSLFNKGGLVGNKARVYDRGGDLLPGYTPAYNGTGHTEYVATTKTDMSNVELSDRSILQLAQAIFSPYNLGRLAQAISNRPAVLAVDGREMARTVSDNMSGLAMPGIEVR